MDEKPDQIIDEIETKREQLGRNLDELQDRVRRSTDWRTYFDRNPALMLGAALGGGILLGSLMSGKRASSREWRAPGGQAASATRRPAGPATSIQRSRVQETMDQVKAALIAFGIAKAKDFLTAAIPGFDQHLEEAERARREQQAHLGRTHGYSGTQEFRTHTEGSYRGSYPSASDYRAPEASPQPVAP